MEDTKTFRIIPKHKGRAYRSATIDYRVRPLTDTGKPEIVPIRTLADVPDKPHRRSEAGCAAHPGDSK
ncbi:MAG: hypothetical protein JO053_13590 [Acidobacteria bacterium]|nr:hypothetical protein [Acidobacteriota bacterium]